MSDTAEAIRDYGARHEPLLELLEKLLEHADRFLRRAAEDHISTTELLMKTYLQTYNDYVTGGTWTSAQLTAMFRGNLPVYTSGVFPEGVFTNDALFEALKQPPQYSSNLPTITQRKTVAWLLYATLPMWMRELGQTTRMQGGSLIWKPYPISSHTDDSYAMWMLPPRASAEDTEEGINVKLSSDHNSTDVFLLRAHNEMVNVMRMWVAQRGVRESDHFKDSLAIDQHRRAKDLETMTTSWGPILQGLQLPTEFGDAAIEEEEEEAARFAQMKADEAARFAKMEAALKAGMKATVAKVRKARATAKAAVKEAEEDSATNIQAAATRAREQVAKIESGAAAEIAALDEATKAKVVASKTATEERIRDYAARQEEKIQLAEKEQLEQIKTIREDMRKQIASAIASAALKVGDADERVAEIEAGADARVEAAEAAIKKRTAGLEKIAKSKIAAARADAVRKVEKEHAGADAAVVAISLAARERINAAVAEADAEIARVEETTADKVSKLEARLREKKRESVASYREDQEAIRTAGLTVAVIPVGGDRINMLGKELHGTIARVVEASGDGGGRINEKIAELVTTFLRKTQIDYGEWLMAYIVRVDPQSTAEDVRRVYDNYQNELAGTFARVVEEAMDVAATQHLPPQKMRTALMQESGRIAVRYANAIESMRQEELDDLMETRAERGERAERGDGARHWQGGPETAAQKALALRIVAIAFDLQTIATALQKISHDAEDPAPVIAGLEERIDHLAGKIAGLTSQNEDLASEAAVLVPEALAREKKIEKLKTKVDLLTATKEQLTQTNAQHAPKVAALTSRIDALRTKTQALAREVQEGKHDAKTLAHRMRTLGAEVRRIVSAAISAGEKEYGAAVLRLLKASAAGRRRVMMAASRKAWEKAFSTVPPPQDAKDVYREKLHERMIHRFYTKEAEKLHAAFVKIVHTTLDSTKSLTANLGPLSGVPSLAENIGLPPISLPSAAMAANKATKTRIARALQKLMDADYGKLARHRYDRKHSPFSQYQKGLTVEGAAW